MKCFRTRLHHRPRYGEKTWWVVGHDGIRDRRAGICIARPKTRSVLWVVWNVRVAGDWINGLNVKTNPAVWRWWSPSPRE